MLSMRRVRKSCPGCQSFLLAALIGPTLSPYRQPAYLKLGGSSRAQFRAPRSTLRVYSSDANHSKGLGEQVNGNAEGGGDKPTALVPDTLNPSGPNASVIPPNEPTPGDTEPEPTIDVNEEDVSPDAQAEIEAQLEVHIQSEIHRVISEFEKAKGEKLVGKDRHLAEDEVRRLVEHQLLFPEETEPAAEDQNHASHEETDPETVVRGAREVFKDTLPAGYLTPAEQAIYNRLYGVPLRETTPDDVGMPLPDMNALKTVMKMESGQSALLKESQGGQLEEVDYHMDIPPSPSPEQSSAEPIDQEPEPQPPSSDQIGFIQAAAKNKREYAALLRLQKDFDATARQQVKDEEKAKARAAETAALNLAEEEWDDIEFDKPFEPPEELLTGEDIDASRHKNHVFSTIGKFATSPKTILIPKSTIVEPITELLKRTHVKHVRLAAETSLGGPGLPHSPATRRNKHGMYPQLPIGIDAGARDMSDIEADVFISTVLPFTYATALSTLTEVRKRMGPDWIPNLLKSHGGEGPHILDVGGGGASAAAWEAVLKAEWDVMRERGEVEGPDPNPHGRKTVIVGSDPLRHRISRFLQNTTFLPRMPDYVHSQNLSDRLMDAPSPSQGRKSYDLIIAANLFMPYSPSVNKKDAFRRDYLLENIWSLLNPDGGVLLVLEKGHPRGFEEVADVRHRLLEEYIYSTKKPPVLNESTDVPRRERVPGRIIAPCTTHHHCPMYRARGATPGRQDFCHFRQRFIRPHFLQSILQAKHFNHEDVQFSYVAVQKGVSPDHSLPQGTQAADHAFEGHYDTSQVLNPLTLPRNILQPLKRTGHVTMDLCTPAGTIERWTIPKSFGKQAYHDARKAKWGDLWALGAKTRVYRTPRLGRSQTFERAMVRRTYNVEMKVGPDGKEHMILPEKARLQKGKKKSKYTTDEPRTSRHNRKIAWEKEVRAMEKEGTKASEVKSKLDELR